MTRKRPTAAASKPPDPRPLLTLAEVADRLGVSKRTLERLIAKRELRTTRVGRQHRVTEDEIARIIESGADR